MVVGVNGFDGDCVYGRAWWSQMYQVSSVIFDQREVKLMLVRKEKKEIGGEGEGLGISCFIKDIDCNGVSKWKGLKKKMKRKESSIVW